MFLSYNNIINEVLSIKFILVYFTRPNYSGYFYNSNAVKL